MQKSLIINAVGNTGTANAGKKYQKSITNVNPAVSNEVAGEFATRANSLTTNVLSDSQVVKKMSTAEEDVVALTVDNASYTGDEFTSSTIAGGIRLTFGENNYIDVKY